MKKIVKIMLGIIVIGVAILMVTPQFTKNKTGMVAYMSDMFNPFVKVEVVYGVVPEKPAESWKDAANGGQDYGYNVKTYTESGSERIVQVTSFGRKMVKESGILKITTKGQYLRQYQPIARDEVPKKIEHYLEGK